MQIFVALNLYGRINYVLIAHSVLTTIDEADLRVEPARLRCWYAHTGVRLLHARVSEG